MRKIFYISLLFFFSSSCKSVIKGTYISPSVALVKTKVEVNDSIDIKNQNIDSTLPPITKIDSGYTLAAKNVSNFFQPTEKLIFKRNGKCFYSVHFLGGGIMGPEIIENEGKYRIGEKSIVISLEKSRALKKGKWSYWENIDKSIKLEYYKDTDTLWHQSKENFYLIKDTANTM